MDYNNKSETYYKNSRPEMLSSFPSDAKTVLDVGCGEGDFAMSIKKLFKTETWGIEYMTEAGTIAKNKLDNVLIGPCENFIDELPDNYFDVIYFNDVLEHLVDPYEVLKKIKSKLSKNGVIISSIPNIRYHSAIKMLLFKKDWKYEKSGVMDKTHLRFFTKKSIRRMYEDLGFKILSHKGINKTKSIKPYVFNLVFMFTATDMFYVQYKTIVSLK